MLIVPFRLVPARCSVDPFPLPAHQTGRAVIPRPAFSWTHDFAHGTLLAVGARKHASLLKEGLLSIADRAYRSTQTSRDAH